ncbi:MAG: HD domain-containing protein [bacterium]|nr:HD domain-containing protein [bacterium]
MTRIERLKGKVDALYSARNPNRADWADWLYRNHIFIVTDNAGKLAERFGAQKDLAMAAAMLHDVADAVMPRESEHHEEESIKLAKCFLVESGFSEDEIKIIVDDAIRFHGCHGVSLPQTVEGKVMSTADALAHLQTEFYDFALRALQKNEAIEQIREWALSKIERDFRKKIFF